MYAQGFSWLAPLVLYLLCLACCTGFNCARLRNAPGSCYIVSKKALNWPAAVAECAERHDGRLATLESSAELDAVMAYLKRIGGSKPFFVGAITVDEHKSWIWYNTGRAMTGASWVAGQPDNAGGRGENCASLDLRAGHEGLADFPCWEPHLYVCEVDTPDYNRYDGRDYIEERSEYEWPWG